MIYRGSGSLAAVRFGSSPTPSLVSKLSPFSVLADPIFGTDGIGGGGGGGVNHTTAKKPGPLITQYYLPEPIAQCPCNPYQSPSPKVLFKSCLLASNLLNNYKFFRSYGHFLEKKIQCQTLTKRLQVWL
jgi:hypothetical protein